jgi:hypothetical protein
MVWSHSASGAARFAYSAARYEVIEDAAQLLILLGVAG